MSDQSILQFLSRPLEGLTVDQLSARLAKLLAAFGFDFFVLVRMSRPDASIEEYVMTGRYDEAWQKTYPAKKYVLVDPVVRYVRKSQQAFRWREALDEFHDTPYYGKMRRMMQDAARHGLEDGYVFPVHGDRGLVGYLSVGGVPRDLTSVQMGLFEVVAKRAFWTTLRLCAPDVADELTASVTVQLTKREMEALSRLADGMTSNEISQVLNISSNTVDWYMNGIQDKLGARNRHHAVAIAFRLGLIN